MRPDELTRLARSWQEDDPDPLTSAAVAAMIGRGDPDEMRAHFGSRLSFGTAGLRGAVGPGPNRMNRLVVRQTTAGLARVLLRTDNDAGSAGVVVGRDARRGSPEFADDVAEVLSAHGIGVHVVDGPAPTPLVAFALRHLRAAAAVVITASHNPPTDNGVKVYWSDGAQIVSPIDAQIAGAIEDVASDHRVVPDGVEPAPIIHLGRVVDEPPLVQAYLQDAAGLVPGPPRHPVRLATTSLHGVGADLLAMALEGRGHGPVIHVESQREPDPAFPTVTFPNPEEPGALDELLELAEATDAALAIANDPDADRLAIAARLSGGTDTSRSPRWRSLTGDECAAVLAQHLLALTDGTADRLLVTTVVSSRLLAAMAAASGAHFAETLTGFKWLSRPAIDHPEWTQVMAYEEALGYAIGPRARDKDGITAALVAADAACSLADRGMTVWDVLDDLAVAHGAHVTSNGATRLEGVDAAQRMMALSERLSSDPPDELGGRTVVRRERPASDVLRMWLDDDTRVVLRPSGTEAKFKHYCEAIEPVGPAEQPDAARERAQGRLASVVEHISTLV